MSDEYIYDKQRIILVLVILGIVIGGATIAVLAWPKPLPKIGDVSSQTNVITDGTVIAVVYDQIFDVNIDTNNTVMLKIFIEASSVYYVDRMTLSMETGEGTQFLAVAVVRATNEADILTGKNDFVVDQATYSNVISVTPDNYVVYVFLIVTGEFDFFYNVRVGE